MPKHNGTRGSPLSRRVNETSLMLTSDNTESNEQYTAGLFSVKYWSWTYINDEHSRGFVNLKGFIKVE